MTTPPNSMLSATTLHLPRKQSSKYLLSGAVGVALFTALAALTPQTAMAQAACAADTDGDGFIDAIIGSATNSNATACGEGAVASGNGSTATGALSQATGTFSTANGIGDRHK